MDQLLKHTVFGPRPARPLVIAHGLFGSARNWRGLGRALSKTRPVITVDMRNHGASFWHPDMTYPAMASDLASVIETTGGSADVLGHSMGGKAAMVLALLRPDLVHRLIVADIAPVAYGHSQHPVIEILRQLPLDQIARRSEAEKMIAHATSTPEMGSFLAQSLDMEQTPPRWVLNLDALSANMDAIIGFPQMQGRFEGETLFLTGAQSEYVDAQGRAEIARLFSQPRFETLDNAGHWLHADQPKPFLAAVDRFLAF